MGWSADAMIWGSGPLRYVSSEGDPALKAAFGKAAAEVAELRGSVDMGLQDGYLHLSMCRDLLEEVIGRHAEGAWPPEEVRAVWNDPRWPDPQNLSGWRLEAYWHLRRFVAVCVEHHLGLWLERPDLGPPPTSDDSDLYEPACSASASAFFMSVNGKPVDDPVQLVRDRIGDLVSGPLTAEVLLERLEREARLLGARDVRVEEFEGWRVISADVDWIAAPCKFEVTAEMAFGAPVPLLEAGESAIRSEVLVTAFARQAVTATPLERHVVAGEVAKDDPVWACLCPLGCARSVAFRFPT